jgi:hypothetical protein
MPIKSGALHHQVIIVTKAPAGPPGHALLHEEPDVAGSPAGAVTETTGLQQLITALLMRKCRSRHGKKHKRPTAATAGNASSSLTLYM